MWTLSKRKCEQLYKFYMEIPSNRGSYQKLLSRYAKAKESISKVTDITTLMCSYLNTHQNTSRYIIELQRWNNSMARDFNISLAEMDRSSRQTMNKDTTEFLIFSQLDLMDICRLLQPSTRHVFSSSVHEAFTKMSNNLYRNPYEGRMENESIVWCITPCLQDSHSNKFKD